jgi:hypothetical protein
VVEDGQSRGARRDGGTSFTSVTCDGNRDGKAMGCNFLEGEEERRLHAIRGG